LLNKEIKRNFASKGIKRSFSEQRNKEILLNKGIKRCFDKQRNEEKICLAKK
jgi:hypothetical protein